jgi:plastocyanin
LKNAKVIVGLACAVGILLMGLWLSTLSASSGDTRTVSGSSASSKTMSTTIHIENMVFQPSVIHVPAGTTVVWKNDDTMTHTVTSGANDSKDNRFDSGDLQPGQTFSYTFQQPGTYAYFCDYHPMMQATVIVDKGNHGNPSAEHRCDCRDEHVEFRHE